MSDAPDVIGVLGAGTMGSGIAQMACLQAGARTVLYDPIPEGLEKGVAGIRKQLARGAEKGRWSEDDARAAEERLQSTGDLSDLADCALVVEAAPESLELKHQLFENVAGVVGEDCVLATNTSSLPVTAIAAPVPRPERVVGMHFFNPAPVMKLLEVVAGEESNDDAVALARAAGEAMGKHVIIAADGPGFLVNRCGRPFGLEGLRLLQEQIAGIEQIDRIVRMGGGFRMGPFELMDLVGVDTGYEVTKSFYELSFYEPRWRPSMITARYAAAGRHGRKTGRGYYDYSTEPYRPEDPEPPAAGGGDGLLVVAGDTAIADELREAAAAAGWQVAERCEPGAEAPFLIVDCGAGPDEGPLQGGPQLILCHEGSLAALDPEGGAAGFHVLPPLEATGLIELTRSETTSDTAAERAQRLVATLGKHAEWVGDGPGLALGRIVCQVINEASFALREGVGSAPDIDAGMKLGLNYPRGPLEWADAIGLDHVLAVLDALCDEYREERYRAAPALRRLVAEGHLGKGTGQGFHSHVA